MPIKNIYDVVKTTVNNIFLYHKMGLQMYKKLTNISVVHCVTDYTLKYITITELISQEIKSYTSMTSIKL